MKYWIATVSHNHVKRGLELGVAQIGHGKRTGLARLHAGDWLVYYSPRESPDGNIPVQAFTAIGQVAGEAIWQANEGDFKPYRRKVNYARATDATIRPLLEQLNFTQDKANWGYAFRYGLFEINEHDFSLIARTMDVQP